MDICYAADENYVDYMCVSLISVIENNKNEDLRFHLLLLEVSEETKNYLKKFEDIYNKVEIYIYNIDINDFIQFKEVPTYPGISLPAYFRLHLSTILPDVNTLLYLDGDTCVNGSLRPIFEINMQNTEMAGVLDINSSSFEDIHNKWGLNDNSYVNSGVAYLNLDYWRESNAEKRIDDFLAEHFDAIKFGDQDILNLVFRNKIKLLPKIYNMHGTTFFNRNTYKKPVIIHHVLKAWNYGERTYYQRKYYKYLRKTRIRFPSKGKEISYRIKSGFVAFIKQLKNPKKWFNKEYFYGIYRYTLRRLYKSE